jgi:hypothetical protein
MSLPLAPSVTPTGISSVKRPKVTKVLGTGVPGIACVNEMKISGVGVGGSTGTGVSTAVGTPLVGARLTETSHARAMRISMDKNRKILFIVEYPFAYIIVTGNKKLPRHWGSFHCPDG